jgi:hypothetical protein
MPTEITVTFLPFPFADEMKHSNGAYCFLNPMQLLGSCLLMKHSND